MIELHKRTHVHRDKILYFVLNVTYALRYDIEICQVKFCESSIKRTIPWHTNGEILSLLFDTISNTTRYHYSNANATRFHTNTAYLPDRKSFSVSRKAVQCLENTSRYRLYFSNFPVNKKMRAIYLHDVTTSN